MFAAYRRGTELDDTRELWLRLVALLESTACPRLAEAALRTMAGDGSVTFGSRPASGIDADAVGLRPRNRSHGRSPGSRSQAPTCTKGTFVCGAEHRGASPRCAPTCPAGMPSCCREWWRLPNPGTSMTNIAYTRTGAGSPLVLLRGPRSSREAWNPVIPALVPTPSISPSLSILPGSERSWTMRRPARQPHRPRRDAALCDRLLSPLDRSKRRHPNGATRHASCRTPATQTISTRRYDRASMIRPPAEPRTR